MTNTHRWRRAGSLLFSIGVGIFIAALLRGVATTESYGTSPRAGSAEAVLGPLLLEPKETRFTITYVQPEGPVDIEILRLPDRAVVLRLPSVQAKEFYDISGFERGLYVFSIKASGNSSIKRIDFTFTVEGPPRDMVYLSLIIGLAGILMLVLPGFLEGERKTR